MRCRPNLCAPSARRPDTWASNDKCSSAGRHLTRRRLAGASSPSARGGRRRRGKGGRGGASAAAAFASASGGPRCRRRLGGRLPPPWAVGGQPAPAPRGRACGRARPHQCEWGQKRGPRIAPRPSNNRGKGDRWYPVPGRVLRWHRNSTGNVLGSGEPVDSPRTKWRRLHGTTDNGRAPQGPAARPARRHTWEP